MAAFEVTTDGTIHDSSEAAGAAVAAALAALCARLQFGLCPRPRADNMLELIGDRARSQAKSRVLGVERSMALEDQAVGRVNEAVEAETRPLVRKRTERMVSMRSET
jgi:hypothetical protein